MVYVYGINKLIFFSGFVELQTSNVVANLKLFDFNIPNTFAQTAYLSSTQNNGNKQFCCYLSKGTKSCIVDTTPNTTLNTGEYYNIFGFDYTI
jgi:hypothetical protein